MKFKAVWFFGGNKKDPELDDYIDKYVAENGVEIDCCHGFTNWSNRWYEVGEHSFLSLAEAKRAVESGLRG